MKKDVIPADEYAGLHGEIASMVDSARVTAARSVNAVMRRLLGDRPADRDGSARWAGARAGYGNAWISHFPKI